MADIESGLKALIETVRHEDIKSIAVPPLGCGNGGLDWNQVRPRIESAFKSLADVAVFLYEPKGAPAADEMYRDQPAQDDRGAGGADRPD